MYNLLIKLIKPTKVIFTSTLLVVAISFQSCETKPSETVTFIDTANITGLTEIRASMFAVVISKDSSVVNFAKLMIADHSQAIKQLKILAQKSAINIPDTLSRLEQKKLNPIAMLYGMPYNKAYLKWVMDDHAKAITLFTDATHSTDTALQAFANKTLPTLKMHLDSAKAIYSSLK